MDAEALAGLLAECTPGEWDADPDLRPCIRALIPGNVVDNYWADLRDVYGVETTVAFLCNFNKYPTANADAALMAQAKDLAREVLAQRAELERCRQSLLAAIRAPMGVAPDCAIKDYLAAVAEEEPHGQ